LVGVVCFLLLVLLASLLSARELLNVVTVCSYWKDVLAQHSLSIWQTVAFRDYCTSPSPPFSLELTKHKNWRDFVLQRHLEKARPTEVWKEFVDTLPNDQCRYIAYCMRRGEKREPYYVFVTWRPVGRSVYETQILRRSFVRFLNFDEWLSFSHKNDMNKLA